MKQAARETEQLKEKLQLQELEAVPPKAIINRVNVEKQPSIISTVFALVDCHVLPTELIAELWSWETKGPISNDIFQIYERQGYFFLIITGLQKFAWIDHSHFLKLWQQNEGSGENLFVEILTRVGPFERFLRWQQTNAPKLVTRDEDLLKAVEKMETRELKRAAKEAAQHNLPPPKLLKR